MPYSMCKMHGIFAAFYIREANFSFIPPAHLCAVIYITEISLNVTLNNQSTTNSKTNLAKITEIKSSNKGQ